MHSLLLLLNSTHAVVYNAANLCWCGFDRMLLCIMGVRCPMHCTLGLVQTEAFASRVPKRMFHCKSFRTSKEISECRF